MLKRVPNSMNPTHLPMSRQVYQPDLWRKIATGKQSQLLGLDAMDEKNTKATSKLELQCLHCKRLTRIDI
jgi:hypothetical protein